MSPDSSSPTGDGVVSRRQEKQKSIFISDTQNEEGNRRGWICPETEVGYPNMDGVCIPLLSATHTIPC